MSANIKASTDGTQAIIGVGGVDQMTVSNAGVVTANSFVGAFVGNVSSATALATGSTTARTLANRFADVVNVKDFGAVGDGVTDDTAAIQAGIDLVSATGGGNLFFPTGRYLVDSATIFVKKGVYLVSDTVSLGEIPNEDYSTLKTAIVLNPSYTILLNDDFTGISGLAIVKKGLTQPLNRADAEALIASFSGTAITVGDGTFGKASDTIVSNCFILGFAQAYQNNKNERAVVEYVKGDCTNGLLFQNQYDVNRISNCQFWPFLTARVGAGADNRAVTYRSGVAYKFETTGNENYDWPNPVSCFSFGYKTGFSFIGINTASMLNCQSDNYAYLDYINGITYLDNRNLTTAVEFLSRTRPDTIVLGRLLTVTNCLFAGQNKGMVINTEAPYFPTVTIVGTSFVSNVTHHVEVIDGRLNFSSGVLKDVEIGPAITVSGINNDGIHVGSSVDFEQIDTSTGAPVTPIFIGSNVALLKSNIDNPNFITGINNTFVDSSLGEFHVKEDDLARNTITKISSNASPYEILFRKARGSSSTVQTVNNNDELGKISFAGHDGTSFIIPAYIRGLVNAAVSTGNVPSALVFGTSQSGSANDRIGITQSGNFIPITNNAYTCGGALNAWSNIYSQNALIVTSDERDKTSIEECSLGLDFVNKLRPVSYKLNVGENKVIRTIYLDAQGNEVDSQSPDVASTEIIVEPIVGKRRHCGLIAQEVKSALPEGVDFGGWVLTDKENPDSKQALRYEQFIAPIIKAVQELSAKVTELESQKL